MKRFLNLYQKRAFSFAVKYEAFGSPASVLKLTETAVKPIIGPRDVEVAIIAAPINPADINSVEGVYGIKAQLPAIAGNEGVAVVKSVGENVASLKQGDWVVPTGPAFGTWRSEAVVPETQLLKIPNDIPAPYAASLTVNPATAYRLLRDFETLKPGDVVIQNGANSMVGMAVVQIAKSMGLKTINVLRSERPEVETAMKLITNLGGDVNVTDEYVNTPAFKELIADLPPIKLALNCVGGESATDLARVLAPNGTMVTYGGMSKEAVKIPMDLLIYKQLKMRGFWISAWNDTHSVAERSAMLEDIAALIRSKDLTFFFELHDFDDFEYALQKSLEPYRLRKVILNMQFPDRLKEHDERPASDYEIFEYPVV